MTETERKECLMDLFVEFTLEDIRRTASLMHVDDLLDLVIVVTWDKFHSMKPQQGAPAASTPKPEPAPTKAAPVSRVYRGKVVKTKTKKTKGRGQEATLGTRGPRGGYLPIAITDNRGIVYESIKDAARQNGVSDTSIRQAIIKGKRVKGILYSFSNPVEITETTKGNVAGIQSGQLSFK